MLFPEISIEADSRPWKLLLMGCNATIKISEDVPVKLAQ